MTKAQAHYRAGEGTRRCSNCSMYGDHSCSLVSGEISPNGLCDHFQRSGGMRDHGRSRSDADEDMAR